MVISPSMDLPHLPQAMTVLPRLLGGVTTTWRFDRMTTVLKAGTSEGYLPLPAEVASALFQVINQRSLKTSIVITTNRPAGAWGEVHPPTRSCVTSALGSEPPARTGHANAASGR